MFELVMAIIWFLLFLCRFLILKQNFLDDRLYLELLISMLYLDLYLSKISN